MTIRPALSLLLLIATGLIGCAGAGGTRTASVPTSLDEAQALAAASGKPLLVDFYTDWCSACALFAADGEADERLIAALDEVVLVKIDAESEGDGQRLAKEFAVHGYPTFIVADARGETIARW
ncbi:MAG TPA: thioredoxin family protein, partial [Candidatus Polarisedimenticolaceae bacterium]|nr:thioredoxin family protein [Candidatus Polarisedimenticolaceae bacterium]